MKWLKRLLPVVTLLVGAAGGIGVFYLAVKDRLRSEHVYETVLVANRSMLPGTRITRQHVRVERLPAECVTEGLVDGGDLEEIVGLTVIEPVGAQTVLTLQALSDDPPAVDREMNQRGDQAALAREDLEPETVLRKELVTLRRVPLLWQNRAFVTGRDLQRLKGRIVTRNIPAGRVITWDAVKPLPRPIWRDMRQVAVSVVRWLARGTPPPGAKPPSGTVDVQLDGRSQVDLGRGAEAVRLKGRAGVVVPSCPEAKEVQAAAAPFKKRWEQVLAALGSMRLALQHRTADVSVSCARAPQTGLATLSFAFDLQARTGHQHDPGSR